MKMTTSDHVLNDVRRLALVPARAYDTAHCVDAFEKLQEAIMLLDKIMSSAGTLPRPWENARPSHMSKRS